MVAIPRMQRDSARRSATRACCALIACALLARTAGAAEAPLLHAIFAEHAVLQRDAPLRVWGDVRPGADVDVAFADRKTRAHADAAGRWETRLPAMHAGGPYTLTARSGGTLQRVDDVLVGDVWLCAGQSNMVLQVKRTLDSRSEIADAHNDNIRMLTVPEANTTVAQPAFAEAPHWLPTTPENVPEFSAACYYFARELQKKIAVPMGLVNASWGGARIEAWMSARALHTVGGYDDALDVLAVYARDPHAAAARWGEAWAKWWHAQSGVDAHDEPWNPADRAISGWRAAPKALGGYQQWGVADLANFIGMVWYRSEVHLTAAQAAQDARLAIGIVDEVDETWVDGRLVGSSYGGDARTYALPPGLLREGANLVVVNALNTYKDGGLIGPAVAQALLFADGSRVPLENWQYRAAPHEYGFPPGAPWSSASGLSTLNNGMLAPLGHYGMRGAVWYQGESNTGAPANYRVLLNGLREDLRAQFGAQLPLLAVQLANYGAAPTHPDESGWAELREAQRAAAADDAHSALALTIDIGDRYDIHPANKQELGRRLARAARHLVYGERTLVATGPVPTRVRREHDTVVVGFDDVEQGLVAYGADGPIGFELCDAKPGTCHYAAASIRGSDVVLRAANASTATRVRYGWADSPIVTLFDGNGLPAGPFERAIAEQKELPR